MSTQVKLRAILLSNEHLHQFIHSSFRKNVLSCNLTCKLKQINLIMRPGYTVSFTLQTSSVLVLSRFNPRILVILVPVGHRWRHNHDGHECLQLILLFSVLLALIAWPEQLPGPAISRLLWTSASGSVRAHPSQLE